MPEDMCLLGWVFSFLLFFLSFLLFFEGFQEKHEGGGNKVFVEGHLFFSAYSRWEPVVFNLCLNSLRDHMEG